MRIEPDPDPHHWILGYYLVFVVCLYRNVNNLIISGKIKIMHKFAIIIALASVSLFPDIFLLVRIVVVAVYHVTIVESVHGLLKKFGTLVICWDLRTTRSFLYLKLCIPAYFYRTTQ